jgi:Ring finger domain
MCSPTPPQSRCGTTTATNTNTTTTLRRHKTLPGPLRSFPTRRRYQDVRAVATSTTMRLSKSNPYVGWFRHAPPSLRHLTAEAAEWLQKTSKNTSSPFLLRRSTSTPTKPCQILYYHHRGGGGGEGENSLAVYRAWKVHHYLHGGGDFTAGMLLGGTTVDHGDLDHVTNKKTSHTNVLSKVAYWLLDGSVFIENPPSLQEIGTVSGTKKNATNNNKKCPSSTSSCKEIAAAESSASFVSQDDEDDSSDELTIESRDEVSPPTVVANRRPSTTTVLVGHNDAADDRLDYNITQMDIVRMNRIASRHLDVESIFSLPTVTYQPPPGTSPLPNNNNNNKDDDNSFSWMLVHSDSEASEAGGGNDGCGTARLYEGCVICLESFVKGDRLRILPCQHKFHISCIDKWLSGANSEAWCVTSGCPTCKASPTITAMIGNNNNEGNVAVPGWAFARIGDALIRESQHL